MHVCFFHQWVGFSISTADLRLTQMFACCLNQTNTITSAGAFFISLKEGTIYYLSLYRYTKVLERNVNTQEMCTPPLFLDIQEPTETSTK